VEGYRQPGPEVHEWPGKSGKATMQISAGATPATLTNPMDKPERSLLPARGTEADKAQIHPHSIETLRVDYAHE
jgi:hypothetical protein